MSEWRLNGFVQDSDDEEDESQIELQAPSRSTGRVERALGQVEDEENDQDSEAELPGARRTEARRAKIGARRKQAVSSTCHRHSPPSRHAPSSSPLLPQATPSPEQPRHVVPGESSQMLGEVLSMPQSEHLEPAPVMRTEDDVLGKFGIEPLSASSDDDALSDPPTDLESPEANLPEPQPHRRTAVQVVIPSSTALQQQLAEHEYRREFRQRKPIQLHPYALEGELYRREVQSRGLKPVARARCSEPRNNTADVASQEKEFDPNKSPSSSPPEPEIPVSTSELRVPHLDRAIHRSTNNRDIPLNRQRQPATQHKYGPVVKKRKPNVSLTQGANTPLASPEGIASRFDVWSIPPNSPLYSSSPLINGMSAVVDRAHPDLRTPMANLPTPSTSSALHDILEPLSESDSEDAPRSAQRDSGELRRPVRIIISDDSASEASSVAEHSDHEVRKVGKRIKGVLPASWLRLDHQAQHRRQVQEQKRHRQPVESTISPESQEPQRGVAQRVTKRKHEQRNGRPALSAVQNMVVLSDDSDVNDSEGCPDNGNAAFDYSAEDAANIAAAFDNRYADDASSDMEDDRLQLLTAAGTAKRKRQSKLTDTLHSAKKAKLLLGKLTKEHAPSAGRHANARRHGAPPPALSVVDIDLSPSAKCSAVPLFIRLARRQAVQRPDLARQSHRWKDIHLHTSVDTADANEALKQWRKGGVKRKANVQYRRPIASREPLSDRTDNQQAAPRSAICDKLARSSSGLQMFRRTIPMTSRYNAKSKKRSTILERNARHAPSLMRHGQLQATEDKSEHEYRKAAFEAGLRQASRQVMTLPHVKQPFMNTQIARFLTDDVSAMDAPTADKGTEHEARTRATQKVRQRIRKKAPAMRLDVEAREYRQPSEPPVQQALEAVMTKSTTGVQDLSTTEPVLQGLELYGTTYPTTFDIHPLQPDTYFHASTFIGSEDFKRALEVGGLYGRDMDERAGYCTIASEYYEVRCGPWDDETSAKLQSIATDIVEPLLEYMDTETASNPRHIAYTNLSTFLRALINYTSDQLSFLDPIDRKSFVSKLHHMIATLFDQITTAMSLSDKCTQSWQHALGVVSYLLVLASQARRIAEAAALEAPQTMVWSDLMRAMVKLILPTILLRGATHVSHFLDLNKQHLVRQEGIKECEVLVEAIVICTHITERDDSIGIKLWDIVSQELTLRVDETTHAQTLESCWATLFTFLPFIEIDVSGIPSRSRRESFAHDSWQFASSAFKRISALYAATTRHNIASLNEYVRSILARCHRLMKFWHWRRPEQMLNAALDFCGKMSLKPLRKEANNGSFHFAEDRTTDQSLSLLPNESYFHIVLKCLGLGLQGMADAYPEKKIRSFVFRSVPNHGRTYPKDQPLDEENLSALRNHHDLLCMLYRMAPAACRPRLDLIRTLVNHESSHREACRVSVRAWANLAMFQVASEEPYEASRPFASWYQDITQLTLKQYRLAKIEADDYMKSGVLDGTSEVAKVMVQQTMKRNQEQAISVLRDCITGARNALRQVRDRSVALSFLVDCDIVHLLELPHFEDHRLVQVIRDTLALLCEFIELHRSEPSRKESRGSVSESQDYGDFPELDDFNDFDAGPADVPVRHNSLDFLQCSLWRLISNAFGAENIPDDDLLMDCVDAWVSIASCQVAGGERTWSYYLDSYQQVSWQQLRHTEQTGKFHPYFLAKLIERVESSLDEHAHDMVGVLLISLADRDSMLRFQHRLLQVLIRVKDVPPLLNNLPFYCNRHTGNWDVNAETLRSRRLGLISSILCNMRDSVQDAEFSDPTGRLEMKRVYSAMLRDFMLRMKSNYQALQEQSTGTGSYVEFVQKVVHFLTQYTSDIQPVLPYFTDSVTFPLPASDPTYVVGRLCGYAPKANESRTGKQLSMFIQTIAQQAAADSQQSYLLQQITTAFCSSQTPLSDRMSLRSALLQGIFPAHITSAFTSKAGYLIAKPIMQSLRPILETTIYDLRCTDSMSTSETVNSIVAIIHAYIRGSEHIKADATMFERSHVLLTVTSMLDITAAAFQALGYIFERTVGGTAFGNLALVRYMEEFSTYCRSVISGTESFILPSYAGYAHTATSSSKADLLAFSERSIQDSLSNHWTEGMDRQISFGPGRAKRGVVWDNGTVEEARNILRTGIVFFEDTMLELRGDRDNEVKHFSGEGELFV